MTELDAAAAADIFAASGDLPEDGSMNDEVSAFDVSLQSRRAFEYPKILTMGPCESPSLDVVVRKARTARSRQEAHASDLRGPGVVVAP